MSGWFRKRKPLPVNDSEFASHQEALCYFLRNRTSLGCYGGGDELERAKKAMRYFACLKLEDIRGKEAQQDGN